MWDKNWLQLVNLTRFGCRTRFRMEPFLEQLCWNNQFKYLEFHFYLQTFNVGRAYYYQVTIVVNALS